MIEKVETMETVNINVLIAERVYPLKVAKQDEEKVKQAVNLVNEKIKQHQTRYAGKDKQDFDFYMFYFKTEWCPFNHEHNKA